MSGIQVVTSESTKGRKGEQKKDCWPCRLISGTGVFGAGLYVGSQAKKQLPLPKAIMGLISLGLCGIGTCRLLGLPPFQSDAIMETT